MDAGLVGGRVAALQNAGVEGKAMVDSSDGSCTWYQVGKV